MRFPSDFLGRFRSTTITPEGRPIKRALLTIAGLWLGITLISAVLAGFVDNTVTKGPTGSMLVTDINGTAALARLLSELGNEVTPMLKPFDRSVEAGTLVIVAPHLRTPYSDAEVVEISNFVTTGGRLVYAGLPHPDLRRLLGHLDVSYNAPPEATVVVPVGGVSDPVINRGIRAIRGSGLPLAGENPVALARPYGRGMVIVIIDSQVLENRSIRENAAWVVSMMGDGPIVWDEYRHGFAPEAPSDDGSTLFAYLPSRARHTLMLLMMVLVISMIVTARRFGPPERSRRDLAPSRRELVDAVGGLLVRTDRPLEVGQIISERITRIIAGNSGLGQDATENDLVAASAAFDLDPTEVRRALSPANDEDLLVAGRVLAQLNERNP